MNKFLQVIAVLVVVVMGLFVEMSPVRAALIVTAVGEDTTTQDNWRTTTTIKPLDPDGNNVYGYSTVAPPDSGYYVFAANAPFGLGGGGGATGPGSDAVTPYDLNGLPTWIAITADGATNFYTGGYPQIDDPTQAPGPSVSDIYSGIAYAIGVPANTDKSLFKLTFGSGTPAQTFRIGLMDNGSTDPVSQFTLSAYNSGNVLLSAATQSFVSGGIRYAFFDVSGAAAGDYLVISGETATGGAGNFALSAITVDIPEPASMGLIGVGGVSLLIRRRRA